MPYPRNRDWVKSDKFGTCGERDPGQTLNKASTWAKAPSQIERHVLGQGSQGSQSFDGFVSTVFPPPRLRERRILGQYLHTAAWFPLEEADLLAL